MTRDDIIRMAREALDLAQDNLRPHGDNCFLRDEGQYDRCFCGKDSLSDYLQSVVEKLDEALAEQPEPQEPVDWEAVAADQAMTIAMMKAEQEPVAWRVWRGDAYELFFSKYAADRRADCFTKRPDVEPLYTSPQSKPWVGLTNKEWQDIVDDSKLDNIGAIKTAIEAKLKEKNA